MRHLVRSLFAPLLPWLASVPPLFAGMNSKMRVIPVIDLMHGQVVRGVAGRRSEYRPMVSRIAADARPATVARALVEQFGFDTAYVADLDAILGGQPNIQSLADIQIAGLNVWLDKARHVQRSGTRVAS